MDRYLTLIASVLHFSLPVTRTLSWKKQKQVLKNMDLGASVVNRETLDLVHIASPMICLNPVPADPGSRPRDEEEGGIYFGRPLDWPQLKLDGTRTSSLQ